MIEELPEWLAPLARAAASATTLDLGRHLPPIDGSARESAVLVALADAPGQGPSVLLIQRAATLRSHAGQVAFPGGSVDPTDHSTIAAALREAEEEVGLDAESVRVVAELSPLFIPVSGYAVTPVLAWWMQPHPVAPGDPGEVARVELVSVAELAEPANRFTVQHPSGFAGPGFSAGGLYIWGFTAMLLAGLLELGGWARDWDQTVSRALPREVAGRAFEPPPGPDG